MRRLSLSLVVLAVVVTIGTVVTWLATDRHYYTKFEVVEKVKVPVAEDDPLAGTGFYEGQSSEKVVTRDEFHLGLLPTPQGLFDKHILSVASLVGATWGLCLPLLWWLRRRRRKEAK